VGVLLTAGDPAVLDFDGLSGIGTWFAGCCRTATERSHLLDGLRRAGLAVEREELDPLLEYLPPRVFLTLNASGASHAVQIRRTVLGMRE
jgi:hypothetical protein